MNKRQHIAVSEDLDADWPSLKRRLTPISRNLVLEMAVRLAEGVPGNIIEFGVAEGHSTRTIRRTLRSVERWQVWGPKRRIYACDSFKGLPEKFENADVGTFACEPPRIRGVEIVEGYFEHSLTPQLAQRVGTVAFASLDADLYSSTLCALRWLTPLLRTGSLILFDEYLGENQSERNAHDEWTREAGIRTVRVAEFLREPSGWGSKPDLRVLFQIAAAAELEPPTVVDLTRIVRTGGRRAASLLKRVAS